MSSKKSVPLVSMAVLCGALLSLAFVNPHNGQITLAELVLQLSGSRGDLPLGTSLPELLSFSIKMAPYFLFELLGSLLRKSKEKVFRSKNTSCRLVSNYIFATRIMCSITVVHLVRLKFIY